MKSLVLWFLLLPALGHTTELDGFTDSRSKAVVKLFKATTVCPSTGQKTKRCPGYIVDHIIPLCADGPDTLDNLQYQTLEQSKIKDKWERKLCSKLQSCNRPEPASRGRL